MYQNKLLFIIVLSILITSLNMFSEEKTLTGNDQTNDLSRSKLIEFDIGFGLKHSLVVNAILRNYENKRVDNDSPFNRGICIPAGQSLGFLLPLSFVYKPSGNFGIGFMASFGIIPVLAMGYFPAFFMVENRLRVVNKFGNFNRHHFLLFEYGVTTAGFIGIPIYGGTMFRFGIGPGFFIGYEKIVTLKYSFTVGFNFDGYYSRSKGYDSYYGFLELNEFDMNIGVEFRWKYCWRWAVNR